MWTLLSGARCRWCPSERSRLQTFLSSLVLAVPLWGPTEPRDKSLGNMRELEKFPNSEYTFDYLISLLSCHTLITLSPCKQLYLFNWFWLLCLYTSWLILPPLNCTQDLKNSSLISTSQVHFVRLHERRSRQEFTHPWPKVWLLQIVSYLRWPPRWVIEIQTKASSAKSFLCSPILEQVQRCHLQSQKA